VIIGASNPGRGMALQLFEVLLSASVSFSNTATRTNARASFEPPAPGIWFGWYCDDLRRTWRPFEMPDGRYYMPISERGCAVRETVAPAGACLREQAIPVKRRKVRQPRSPVVIAGETAADCVGPVAELLSRVMQTDAPIVGAYAEFLVRGSAA